ncbi:MAG: ABC transporter ATP-binding protein [Candidatus Methanofastidiosia archaeon]
MANGGNEDRIYEKKDIAFSTSHLSKSYKDVLAIQDLSISVKKGAIGLLGPNGAGKSTLIRVLLGLIKPTEGSYELFTTSNNNELYLDRIGYMPEHDCLAPNISAVGVVSYMGQLSGLPADIAMERTHDMLDYVDLGEERYRKIKTYSSGMKQKVKMAQALVHDPDLIFFDEPTNGLDPEGRSEMLTLLDDVAKSKKSIVLSSHLLPDIEHICDDVIILNNGKMILYDDLKSVLGSQRLIVRIKGDKARFSKSLQQRGITASADASNIIIEGDNIQSIVFEEAARMGVQIRYMAYHSKTLEDIFLHLVGDGNE